jgi:enoyl-CoA hydratase
LVDLVRIDQEAGGIVRLTVDDPANRNALGFEMASQFGRAVDEIASTEVRVVVLTGAPPVFSAGGDLAMIDDQRRAAMANPAAARSSILDFYRSFLSMRSLPVPVIAAVNGHAVGAGLCLAAACDMRVVADTAKIGANFAALGLHPGMGATVLLPMLMGPDRAADLLYTAQLKTGRELAGTGWAAATVAPDLVVPRAMGLARAIAQNSADAIRRIAKTLRAVPDQALSRGLEAEASAQTESLRSDDLAEALQAVRDKRAPRFEQRPSAVKAAP